MNLGGGIRYDEDGNAIPGKMIDMVVEGENVYIVSVQVRTVNLSFNFFFSHRRRTGGSFFWMRQARPVPLSETPGPLD